MSLQYIIDGYNITNHPQFRQHATNKHKYNKSAAIGLLEFILENKLCGSPRNTITLVFDGYPDVSYQQADVETRVIFSRKDSADERIRKILEVSSMPASMVVVSDDKEVQLSARVCGAKAISVEEFITSKEKKCVKSSDLTKPDLSYTQMHKINEELKKIWLK